MEGNPTSFFDFEEHAPENLAKFNQYRKDSEAALDEILSPDYKVKTYIHNKEEVFDLFNDEDLSGKIMEPGFDHARKTIEKAKAGKV